MNRQAVSQRTQRLRRIAQQLGAVLDTNPLPLTRPSQPPSFVVYDDERKADAILGQLKIEEAATKPQPKGLKRYSLAKAPKPAVYTHDELYTALARTIDENGLPGVVEVLLRRFLATGGDVNVARRASTGVMKRIRSNENVAERGRLLHSAAERQRYDLVQLFAPYADQVGINESLHIALNGRDIQTIETLLQYGANSALYEGTFIEVAKHGDVELLDLLLRARVKVSDQCISRSLLPATMSGSIQAVLLLMRAGANGDLDNASGLMHAVEIDRPDLAAAILLSQNPPSGPSVDRALDAFLSTPTSPTGALKSKQLFIEILLCGGPVGNAANEGLFKATLLGNAEMIQLLLAHNADINYNGASAVAHAIQRNRGNLVGILLQEQVLRPEIASELVHHISRTIPAMDKVAILSKLLVNGATGPYCSELLIVAAELGDMDTAQLLISYGRDQGKPVCSVDYNAARCLQIAVARNNIAMVKLLALDGKPTKFSLANAFSAIPPNLSKDDNFIMIQTLLRGGAEGPEVNEALHAAVTAAKKSIRLIELLVQFNAVITEQTFFACISQAAVDVLDILLTGAVPATTCASAIPTAMKLPTNATRFKIMKLLLAPSLAAGLGTPEISQAVIDILQNCPEDLPLLRLLCREGKPDLNLQAGLAVTLATKHPDLNLLETVLQSQGSLPNSSTIERGLRCSIDLPLTDTNREKKVEALLRRVKPQEAMNKALIHEIKSALATKQDLSVVQQLLDAGADVNCHDGAPVCLAISDPAIMDLILSKRPRQKSLASAFPLAIGLQDPARYVLCEKLLKAGAVGEEISKALYVIVKEGVPVLPLMTLLLPQADVNYKEGRALRLVVRQVFLEGLDLLLTPRSVMPSSMTKTSAFQEAMNIKGQKDRLKFVSRLLTAGIQAQAISDALVTAVNIVDFELTELLLQSKASVEHHNGAAVHSAACAGETNILKLLVSGKYGARPTLSTLTAGFGGALSLKEAKKDSYYDILQILLEAGMRGEGVDNALVEAVREGDPNIKMTQLLVANGASVDWHDGEAVDIAAKTASIETLNLLLGRKPPQHVLARAWRSAVTLAEEQRFQVIDKLLQAGKAIDNHVAKALTTAVTQNPSDRKLAELLLKYEAFDRGESVVHAARVLDLRTLQLLLNSSKAADFISPSFKEAMTTDILWQSATGLKIVELFLKKGATGDAVAEALYQAVEKCEIGAEDLAADFLEVLLQYGADVNYQRGLVLQRAAMQGNLPLLKKLLPTANSESKAMAIPYLFTVSDDKASILKSIEAFQESFSDGEESLDITFKHPDENLEPVLFLALSQFPRDTQILRALLDVGYNPNQWQMCGDDEDDEGEPWPVLCWALDQPEKKISSANIEMLIDTGANISFKSRSGTTPLVLAIRYQRADIVAKLISKGANVTEPDQEGITPLTLASSMGNTTIMEALLDADAENNDGSLHDVSRQLRIDAMRTLIRHGHEVDYPSDRHGGRSALAELCLGAVDNNPKPARLEEAISCLIAHDANIRLQRRAGPDIGKTIFHYALDSSNPLLILTVLLKMMWKIIDEPCFLFKDKTYTYSLTKYVEKGLYGGPKEQKQDILDLFHNKDAVDRYWANDIEMPQPADYCGAPPHIEQEVQLQKTREKRRKEQEEDMMYSLGLKKTALVKETELMEIQTVAEIQRDQEKGRAERELITARQDTILRLEMHAESERERFLSQKRLGEVRHQKALGDVQISTQRAIKEEQAEMDRTKSMMQIEFLDKKIGLENEGVRARLAIEGSAFQDQDRVMMRQHERELARLKTQKQLVDSQTTLAGSFQSAGVNQRQIGYITGELS